MDYEELLSRADMSVRIHDYDEAIKFVKKAIDISHSDSSDKKTDKERKDSDAALYLLLGSIYQKNGDFDRASDCYNTTIEKNPHCVEAYNNLGVIAKIRLDYQKAIDFFQQALKVNPNRADIYYNLGNVYKLMGNKEFAKDSFEQTLKLKPDYVTAYNNLGNILDSMGQYQYALAVYQKGMKIDFNNWKLHYNIAITFEKIGNIAEAENHYRKAIEINPTFIEAFNNLGILYEKNGNYDAAKKCYHDLLSFNPDYNKGHNNLGRTYEYLGEPDKALAEYNKALEGNPNYKIALNNGAKLCYDRHDYKNAERMYERLLRMEKNNYTARVRLANIKEETASFEAIQIYNDLIEKNEVPEDLPALHKHLADTYALLGQNEEALKHYQIVRQMQSNDTDNMMRMAKLSEKLGLIREAITILEEARQNNESDPQIMESLGDAYMQSGENEKAIDTLKTLQSIAPDKENIYNLAKAERAAGHSDEALQYMNELLSTDGDESLLDLDNLSEKLRLYEEMLAEMTSHSGNGDDVLDKLKDYTMEELLADPEPEDDQNNSDALSELEESLIAETDNGKLISFGDNAPVYDVEEEEEILDATDAEEDKTAGGNSFLNLLKGQDTYGEMFYRKEEEPEPELPPPPPPPKPPNPYEGLPPPTINVSAENAMDDDRLVRLEDAILKLTEQIVNLMRGNPEIYGGLPLADENDQLKQQINELTQKLEGSSNPDEPEFASFDDLDKNNEDYEFASYEDLDDADDTASRLLHENESDDNEGNSDIDDDSTDSTNDEDENSFTEESRNDEDEDSSDEDVIDTPVEISDDGEELIFTEEDDDDDDYEDEDIEEKEQVPLAKKEEISSGDEKLSDETPIAISAPEEELVFAEEDDVDDYEDVEDEPVSTEIAEDDDDSSFTEQSQSNAEQKSSADGNTTTGHTPLTTNGKSSPDENVQAYSVSGAEPSVPSQAGSQYAESETPFAEPSRSDTEQKSSPDETHSQTVSQPTKEQAAPPPAKPLKVKTIKINGVLIDIIE